MARRPRVLVCNGSDCRKAKQHVADLVRAVEALAEVETVKCQKICKGPVVGLEVGGELEWFRKMDSDKARRRLVKLLTTGEMKKALQKRRVGSRSGKKRA